MLSQPSRPGRLVRRDWEPIFQARRLEDHVVVNFFRKLQPGERFNVEWVEVDACKVASVAPPSTRTWKGTYLQQCPDDGSGPSFRVNYDEEPSNNRVLPTGPELVVLKLVKIHDQGLAAASTNRIPPFLFSSRPNFAFTPEMVIHFDGGWDNHTRMCNCAI
jgi:hypothetical protein